MNQKVQKEHALPNRHLEAKGFPSYLIVCLALRELTNKTLPL